MNRQWKIFLVGFSLLALIACQDNREGKGKVEEADTMALKQATKDSVTVADIQKVTAHFPSPVDFVSYINHANLEYQNAWLNPINRVNEYLGRPEKAALNLGVYLSDLGYQSIYMKSEAAMQYFKTAKQLSDQLNILNQATNTYLKRFEANLSNRDSLLTITREAYYSIDEYLRENEKTDLAALIVTGAWIEGLYGGGYILTALPAYFEDKKYRPLIYRIGAQKSSLQNIITMLEKIDDVEEVKAIVAELKKLLALYAKVEVVEASSQEEAIVDIAEVQNIEELTQEVVINSVKEVKIDKATFDAIYKQISKIRQMIVKP